MLVMGGSYFIGRVFVEEALVEGRHDLTVANRGNQPLGFDKVEEVRSDRNDPGSVAEVAAGRDWDAVVDFCAYKPEEVQTLFSGLSGAKVARYVLVSSCAVYEPTERLPVSEDAETVNAPRPGAGPAATYGHDKRLAEIAALAQCTRHKISCTLVRPTFVYGPYNYAPRESWFFDLIERGENVILPENGLALHTFVYVVDVARALLRCIASAATGNQAYNLAAPELVSYARMAEVFGEVTRKPVHKVRMPAREIESRRIPLPFPLDTHSIFSGHKFAAAQGFTYTPLADGMAETYDWWKKARSA
ncbi:MAG: NAD-dependent epimerase/dehydratase family protein [Desulfatibacillaceae bacterium]